MPPPDCILCMR